MHAKLNTQVVWIALLLLGALLLGGCRAAAPALSVPPGARPGDLAGLAACDFQPAGSKAIYAAECATLVVPENWAKEGARLIALPVVRIPARGPEPAEPVFWLVGGPGGPNLSWEPPAWLLARHDVVMVGYRGVEGTVTLACPEVNRLMKAHIGRDAFSETARAGYVAAAQACAAAHQAAGVDLAGYTIPGVVEDLEAARKALGYARIHLFSESYGTRIAQIYAYLHPASLRRLVLIGVNTPGHFVWDPAVFDQMIGRIAELCRQDAACSRRTADFAQTMYTVNHTMPDRWLLFRIDPDTVRMGAHFLFMSNPMMPLVFDAYLAAAAGDPSGRGCCPQTSRSTAIRSTRAARPTWRPMAGSTAWGWGSRSWARPSPSGSGPWRRPGPSSRSPRRCAAFRRAMWRCCWSTAPWISPRRPPPWTRPSPTITRRRRCCCRSSAMWAMCTRSSPRPSSG
ncbi:MAG: hypothetical protein DCC57_17780 [Chloroflexi bacterium]|nr:MAG: hypothetical protein DCC57_17780 [Chloroflexota bacterium]